MFDSAAWEWGLGGIAVGIIVVYLLRIDERLSTTLRQNESILKRLYPERHDE